MDLATAALTRVWIARFFFIRGLTCDCWADISFSFLCFCVKANSVRNEATLSATKACVSTSLTYVKSRILKALEQAVKRSGELARVRAAMVESRDLPRGITQQLVYDMMSFSVCLLLQKP